MIYTFLRKTFPSIQAAAFISRSRPRGTGGKGVRHGGNAGPGRVSRRVLLIYIFANLASDHREAFGFLDCLSLGMFLIQKKKGSKLESFAFPVCDFIFDVV